MATTDGKPDDVRPLGVRLAPEARRFVDEYLAAVRTFEPTLGLLYGNGHAAEATGSWSVIAYSDAAVQELVEFYANFGASVRFELDGVPVVIPQIGRAGKLNSGVLEMRDNRLLHTAGQA
jgi:hypothetical protein